MTCDSKSHMSFSNHTCHIFKSHMSFYVIFKWHMWFEITHVIFKSHMSLHMSFSNDTCHFQMTHVIFKWHMWFEITHVFFKSHMSYFQITHVFFKSHMWFLKLHMSFPNDICDLWNHTCHFLMTYVISEITHVISEITYVIVKSHMLLSNHICIFFVRAHYDYAHYDSDLVYYHDLSSEIR